MISQVIFDLKIFLSSLNSYSCFLNIYIYINKNYIYNYVITVKIVGAFLLEDIPYIGGAAPRTLVVGHVFTTNESPPEMVKINLYI